ncbi:cytochrome P450 [Streptacidiphilus sp. EB129]|uniref:cytochrome P450 n=1 Tax=Streptacidiphilus sp. EB129 TaxID=3156262 RepID=UPI0035125460
MTTIPAPRTPAQIYRVVREMSRSLPHGLTHMRQTYGDVCAFGMGPTRTVFLFGPEANELVLRDPDTFRFTGAYDMLRPIAGDTALVVTDGPDHDRRRRAAQPSFHRGGMERCAELIVEHVDAMIDGWAPGQRVDIYQELRQAVRMAMVRSFCGEVLAAQTDYLAEQLEQVHDLMNYPLPRQLVAWRLPFPARRRAFAGIAGVEGRIYAEITRRRRSGDEPVEDLISVMMAGKGADGGAMKDQEVRDMVVSALIAGYDPVSAGLGWAVYHSLAEREVWRALHDEAEAVLDGAAAGPAELRRLRYVGQVVNESLRMRPPVVMSPRRCTRAFSFGGYTVPAGSLVAVSEYITQRDAGVWDEPNRFRPERWDPDSEGYRAPSPFEYLPFGYGARRCIGAGIAGTAIPAALSRLVQRAELELLSHDPQPAGIPAMYPRDGLLVRVRATRPAGKQAATPVGAPR